MTDYSDSSDIAIIGLALRVPGARNASEFWQNLRAGVESIQRRTLEELIAAGESAEVARRRNYVPVAAELPGMADFDPEFFGFSPKDAAIMDPQHRQFLECAWEALEDAAYPPEKSHGPVGVFAGCGMGSYFYFNICSNRPLVDQVGMFLLRHTGNDKDFLATRASYLFDLHGPSINVQTACSTSLVAIHYAAQSLLNGECEMAIAGGVTVELPHGRGYLYQEGEILSPDGHCRAFDHRAAGTVFGSGVGVVVLKKLSDALANGDPIRAVIKSTAINNDGAGKASYLAPSVTGQAEAIVEAQALAGVSPDSIQYVECHGTGTNLGDPIEIAALTQAFRLGTEKKGFCRVGSVKTNIGHLDTAAGVVSVIKAVLALENGEIPPSLGYEAPNPAIDFEASPFVVADRLMPWPQTSGPRRAAVNSLGVGGTNAHAILEQAPSRASLGKHEDSSPQILVLSARNRKALGEASVRLASHIEAHPALRLDAIAHTLLTGRRLFEQRRVVAVSDRSDAVAALSKPELRRGAVHTPIEGLSGAVLMFPGGGAQYPGMGRTLYQRVPVFTAAVDEGLSYLSAGLGQQIRNLWLGMAETTENAGLQLLRPSLQLPAILIIEVAMARLWQSWGLKPTSLIGHSMGEYAAACIADVMGFESAVKLVQLRGELFDEIEGGGMLSVRLTAERLRERIPERLDIAVINAPELCVVSGPKQELAAFGDVLVGDGIEVTSIPINIAAHSRMLEPILDRFEAFLRATPLSSPRIAIVSNLTGTWMTAEEATDPRYWVKHLRSTVRFADGLAILASEPRLYIEAGPGRTLSSLVRTQGSIDANAIINSLPHADEAVDDWLYFLTAVGRAWSTGLDLPIDRLCGNKAVKLSLPTYPFQHQRYFLDRIASSTALETAELTVKRPDMADWGWTPTWKLAYADSLPGADDVPASYLVFLDDTGIGAELVSRLRSKNHQVTSVVLGDAFSAKPDGSYTLCPELGREGYEALLRHLAEHGGVPNRLVHLWLLTADKSYRPGSSFFHRNQERGFYSLFFLAQALSEADATDMQVTIITNGMQRVGAEPLHFPEKSTVLGPAQVMGRELPHVHVRILDIPLAPTLTELSLFERSRRAVLGRERAGIPADAAQAAVDLVWDDLFAEPGNEIVAYRDGRRRVRSYRQIRLGDVSDSSAAEGRVGFRDGGVYIITGGLGDLAIACAQDLGRKHRARIALLGRLELPDRARWPEYRASGTSTRVGRAIAAIESIEQAGGEVLYVRADVTIPDSVRKAVQSVKSQFGDLNGVLHAAGVVKDDLIQLKSITDIEDVLAPKVLGTLVLHEVLATEKLDFMVLFSSTSTDTAPAGQVDYVAANAFLNAFAESRASAGGVPVMALHWGIWNDVGLAARAVRDAESDKPRALIDAASQPLFERRVHTDVDGDWLDLRASSARQWLLDEHRLLSGEAVWPGSGYLELVLEAAREFGLLGAIEVTELSFLRPLHVPEGQTRDVRVRVNRQSKQMRIVVESCADAESGMPWLRHAEASVAPSREPRPAAIDLAAALGADASREKAPEREALDFAQSIHLRTGRRWQVLRELHLGAGRAIARLSLDPAFEQDLKRGFVMHPALTDIATGYAMALILDYRPEAGLWVPVSYGRVCVYGALPASIWTVVTLSDNSSFGPGFATFDVTIADDNGNVLVVVDGFTVKQLEAGTDFTAALHDIPQASKRPVHGQTTRELSPAMARLAAQVEQGITPQEGGEALRRAIALGLPEVIVSSMDLTLLIKAAARREPGTVAPGLLERPNIDSEFVAPSSEIEKVLAGFWSELLGIERIGVTDDFFDLGGYSLIAVRLFRMIKKAFSVDFPISVLFEAPTIAECAKLIEASSEKASGASANVAAVEITAPREQYTHLVPMHAGRYPHETPLFVCAGMFGNILNLRHLALHIGQDRPVYGLQARGIYGGQAPHETFEEMAQSYLHEVRMVQPHGPYLLGGFSGGGLVAYEMAQILLREGEVVDLVVMLDTPYPEEATLSTLDKVSLKLQDLRREKGAFLVHWARRRLSWELDRLEKSRKAVDHSVEQFHNTEIEAAFRHALGRYDVKTYDGRVLLLRPRLQVAYRLRDGTLLHSDRNILRPDNGWSPFVPNLSIKEVPGNHDSMVLEPSVRILSKYMRDALNSAGDIPRLLAAE